MPTPGQPVPYPPYPAAGAAASGALQYALEVTLLLVKSELQAIKSRLPEIPHAQPLTDAQLRALAVNVTGPLTQAQLVASGLNLEETQEVISGILNAALNVGLSTRASETKQQEILDKLHELLLAAQAIAIDADSIAIDADTINLSTDQLENLISLMSAKLPVSLGQKLTAESLSVCLSTSQEAILAVMVDKLTTLAAKDFATEVTLAAIGGKLPSALHLDRFKVSDRMTGFEARPAQDGAGGVLTFTFQNGAPDLVWVRSVGGVSFADPSGGDPAENVGAYCADDEPHPLTLSGSSTLKVWAPAQAKVHVWGYRYS